MHKTNGETVTALVRVQGYTTTGLWIAIIVLLSKGDMLLLDALIASHLMLICWATAFAYACLHYRKDTGGHPWRLESKPINWVIITVTWILAMGALLVIGLYLLRNPIVCQDGAEGYQWPIFTPYTLNLNDENQKWRQWAAAMYTVGYFALVVLAWVCRCFFTNGDFYRSWGFQTVVYGGAFFVVIMTIINIEKGFQYNPGFAVYKWSFGQVGPIYLMNFVVSDLSS